MRDPPSVPIVRATRATSALELGARTSATTPALAASPVARSTCSLARVA